MSPHAALQSVKALDPQALQLRIVQPALIGLIDGTISTLAPIFAAAYVSGSEAALVIGMAAALGAAISMGLSADGTRTRRRAAATRGLITGVATFVGGFAHALPFLISDVDAALRVAYPVVAAELVLIAWIRKRYQHVSMRRSLIQVTLGGALVVGVGVLLGHV